MPVFVYGTLMEGGCRHSYMTGSRFLGRAQTMPEYRLFNCGSYPAMVRSSQGVAIQGELWEVSADCLSVLDEVEGVSEQLYEREAIDVTLLSPGDGEALSLVRAWTYLYVRSTQSMADLGDHWRHELENA